MYVESGQGQAAWRDQELARGLSGNTVRINLALLSHLFEMARKEWGYGEGLVNPCKLIRKPKLPRGRTRRLAPGEEGRLMESLKGAMRDIVAVAVETAMRRGELIGLTWKDIDLQVGIAYLHETKNGDARKVPLSGTVRRLLSARKIDTGGVGPVFGFRDADSITKAFLEACKRAGIDGLHFHDLRHEATSRLFELGLSTVEVAAITGHKTLSMLQRYTHLRVEDLARKLG